MSMTIRKIEEPEELDVLGAAGGTAPMPTPVEGTTADGAAVAAPAAPASFITDDERWGKFITRVFGDKRGAKILAMKRCGTCGGRMRPYTSPKDGAASNRAFGVTPGLRCSKCGRDA